MELIQILIDPSLNLLHHLMFFALVLQMAEFAQEC
jgi:hypothetical protein